MGLFRVGSQDAIGPPLGTHKSRNANAGLLSGGGGGAWESCSFHTRRRFREQLSSLLTRMQEARLEPRLLLKTVNISTEPAAS